MNARLEPDRQPPLPTPRPMGADDIDAVFAVEVRAYPYPWSRGNLVDSLVAGHWAVVSIDEDAQGEKPLIGYAIAMPGVDELHLLNLTVAPECQGRGFGRALLDAVLAEARARGAARLLLEVRESNWRARRLYLSSGFVAIGRRRGYYPGRGGREDAVVMQRVLDDAPGPPAAPGSRGGLD